MDAGFVEGERVLLEGISAAGAPGGDKLVLRPARISSMGT
jgi:hypothetical protein